MGRGNKRIMVTTNKIGKPFEGVEMNDTRKKRNTNQKKKAKRGKK